MDDGQCQGQGMNKCSAGSKDTCPIGNKKAKQLRKVEEMVEHIGATLGIVVKKEEKKNNTMPEVDQKVLVGDALKEIVSITHAGFSSWEQSIYFQHADENLKQQLANAHLHHEIMCLENEMEQVEEAKNKKKINMHDKNDVVGAFMQLSEMADENSAIL